MDKTLLGLVALFFVAFAVFMTFFFFNDQITTAARASNQSVSPQRSLVFAWPLNVKADGKEKSTISVFVRDEDGRAVADKNVRLTSTLGQLSSQSARSDKLGKVEVTLTSAQPGLAEIEAFVDNTPIRTKISIKFE